MRPLPSERLMVVAPHADDELLGVGGTLLRYESPDLALVLVCCSDCHSNHRGAVVPASEREREFRASAAALGAERTHVMYQPDAALDTVPLLSLVTELDRLIDEWRPETVVIPEPSMHPDHQQVNRACLAALRPSRPWRPRRVVLYEVPTGTIGPAFAPNLWVDINSNLQRKRELFTAIYRSQATPPGRGRSADDIERHARFRGLQCGCEYAEAFQVIREVV